MKLSFPYGKSEFWPNSGHWIKNVHNDMMVFYVIKHSWGIIDGKNTCNGDRKTCRSIGF